MVDQKLLTSNTFLQIFVDCDVSIARAPAAAFTISESSSSPQRSTRYFTWKIGEKVCSLICIVICHNIHLSLNNGRNNYCFDGYGRIPMKVFIVTPFIYDEENPNYTIPFTLVRCWLKKTAFNNFQCQASEDFQGEVRAFHQNAVSNTYANLVPCCMLIWSDQNILALKIFMDSVCVIPGNGLLWKMLLGEAFQTRNLISRPSLLKVLGGKNEKYAWMQYL